MKAKTIIGLVVSCLITTLTGFYSLTANAAGFALIENGASGLGNAYAGASAVAEDASTVYFNPAGLSKLEGRQFVFAGHYISTVADFTNSGSEKSSTLGGGALSGPNADGGTSPIIPSFFYAARLNNDWSYGLGVTVPFGLGTEYDENWIGRYHAIKSEIHTININPSASYKVNEKVSMGFGISAQHIEATLSNKLDSAAYCLGGLKNPASLCSGGTLNAANIGNSAYDSQQLLNGEDWSFGWNVGLLYDFTPNTRFGMSYRSNIDHHLTGTVDFTVDSNLQAVLNAVGSSLLSDTGVSAGINLPESVSFSLAHIVDSKWKIMADATWTRWERYDKLITVFDNPSQPASVASKHYKNNWRYSVGASYQPDMKKTYRFGLAYDESAVRNAVERTAGSPGNDRLWLSLGYGQKFSDTMQFDIGYAHLFIDDTPIDNTHALWGSVTGSFEQSVDILSVQLSWLI